MEPSYSVWVVERCVADAGPFNTEPAMWMKHKAYIGEAAAKAQATLRNKNDKKFLYRVREYLSLGHHRTRALL